MFPSAGQQAWAGRSQRIEQGASYFVDHLTITLVLQANLPHEIAGEMRDLSVTHDEAIDVVGLFP